MDTPYIWGFRPEFAILLLVACVMAGGVLGALVRAWSILSRLYSLEDRVVVLEGTVTREVKIRAANSRPTRTDKDILKVDDAVVAQPAPAVPWWQAAAQRLPRAYGDK